MRPIDIYSLARRNVLSLTPYASARDDFRGQASVFLDANENPFPSPYNRYPDGRQQSIRKAIAKLRGLEPEEVLLTHGSDEAIDLLIRGFCEPATDNIIIPKPTYGMYETSASVSAVKCLSVDLSPEFDLDFDAIESVTTPATKLIFLCSPNNPTGNLLSAKKIVALLKSFRGLVVVDEAYLEFARTRSLAKEIRAYRNLVILQTFSKAWGLAGLRAGVCLADREVIRLLFRIKPPYNMGSFVERKLLDVISHNQRNVNNRTRTICQQREKLIRELSKLAFISKVYPSQANFILVSTKESQKVYHQLLQHGIVVRLRQGLPHAGDCLRITVGTPVQNKKLIQTLRSL